jgi:hypothetical protein
MARQLLQMAGMTVVADAPHWLHMARMPLDAYSSRARTRIRAHMRAYMPHISEIHAFTVKYCVCVREREIYTVGVSILRTRGVCVCVSDGGRVCVS